MPNGVLLSLFPGAGLFDRGFLAEGFYVLRGPDLLYGQRIEDFHAPRGVFEGVFGGSPCQDFSGARRTKPTGEGLRLLDEFSRVVVEASPDWWLLENVPRVPDVDIPGYIVQRFNLRASECGCRQRRLRRFQFGSRDGAPLVIARQRPPAGKLEPAAMASEWNKPGRRDWASFCELQGLPPDFDLPGLGVGAKYAAVGNGVPVRMACVVAAAIRHRCVTPRAKLCVCECGRTVEGKARHATAACRKRMERSRRDFAGVTEPGPVTLDESRSQFMAS